MRNRGLSKITWRWDFSDGLLEVKTDLGCPECWLWKWMELGSTIHRSWFKRFKSFLELGDGSPWFDSELFLLSSSFTPLLFLFWFILLLGLDSSCFTPSVPLVGSLLIFFMLSCFRWYVTSLALPQGFYSQISSHIHTLRLHQLLIIIFLCLL